MIIDNFPDPPVENRPRPFWFFNGDMDKDEIRHQIMMMKKQGLGGFFICARQGLKTPYLSEDWFDICKYAVQTAKECGLEAWLYDEYPYPSGMSGGEVTICHPEAKQKTLELRVIDLKDTETLNESLGEGTRLISAVAWQLTDGVPCWEKHENIAGFCGILQNSNIYQKTEGNVAYRHNYKRYFSYGPSKELRWKPAKGGRRVLIAFTRDIEDFKYYGTFLDPANKDAVKCFIDTTHEPAKKALGEEFGKTIKGIFGDETGFLGRFPWSLQLTEYFQRRFGYSIADNLCALVDSNYPDAKRIRYHYYQCFHELLKDRYHKPISKWCEENGISYVTEVPSMRMSNQMYTHIPGGDCCHDKLGILFEKIIERDFRSIRGNPKMVSAMARQFNRKGALIEAFHSLGWTATIQDMKWQIDRLTLSGVSFHNFHAFYYTVDGITKHDAPPSQFIQNPYFEHYKIFADYCARSSRFITETEASISTAVFHPAIDLCTRLRNQFSHLGYCGCDKTEEEDGKKLIDNYINICKTLFSCQIDYDDLDSEVMAAGQIENGVIKIGRAKYYCLIVPPIAFMEKYAFDLLLKFYESGGKLIFTGGAPYLCDDKNFDLKTAFESAFGTSPLVSINAGNELSQVLRDIIPVKTEVILGGENDKNKEQGLEQLFKKGIISGRREKRDSRFIMIASQNGEEAQTKVLFRDCPDSAAFFEFDLESGSIFNVCAEKTGEGFLIDAPLSPWSARVFAMVPASVAYNAASGIGTQLKQNPANSQLSAIQIITKPPAKTLSFKLDLDRKYPVSIAGGNVYRLEELSVSINDSPSFKSKPNTFIEHFKEFAGNFDGSVAASVQCIKFSDGFGIPKRLSVNYPLKANYHFEFYINNNLIAESSLKNSSLKIQLLRDKMAIMGKYEIKINNSELPDSAWEPLRIYDQNNIAADITSLLKDGLNTIDVCVSACEDWHGLSDPMYLLGNFGVYKNTGKENPACGEKFYIGKTPDATLPNAKAVEGYPFYSGKLSFDIELFAELKQSAHDYQLFTVELPEKYRIYECVHLSVNGCDLGIRAFSPYIWQGGVEILKQGQNSVKLTIINTLGNMFEGSYFDYDEYKTVLI